MEWSQDVEAASLLATAGIKQPLRHQQGSSISTCEVAGKAGGGEQRKGKFRAEGTRGC
jgi:hypothetical protein